MLPVVCPGAAIASTSTPPIVIRSPPRSSTSTSVEWVICPGIGKVLKTASRGPPERITAASPAPA